MRKYYLASTDARVNVDLRDYAEKIISAVRVVMPDAEVVVEQRWYSVSPTPERGAAIKIGRALSKKNVLGKHCVQIPKLFNSISDEKKEKKNDNKKQPRHGGHQ